jgi:hypothetical protein
MTMKRMSCLLLVLLLGLGGCSTTVFESIPVGTTTDCDPAWPGRWQPVERPGDVAGEATGEAPGDATKPKDALEISADCRTATTKGDAKPKPMHLTLVDGKAGQFLQVHNDSGEPDCIGDGKAHCGYVLLRYERDGDTIRLYDPDHARVAAAIGKGSIKGFSERADGKQLKTSEPVHRNFIAGDAAGIAKLLRRHPELFNSEPLMELHRVAATPTPTPTDDANANADAAAAEAAAPVPEQ